MQVVLLRKLLCATGYAIAFFYTTDTAHEWLQSSHLALYSTYALGVVAFGSMGQIAFVRCPRCGDRFHGHPLRSNIFRFKCKSCHFPREEPAPSG